MTPCRGRGRGEADFGKENNLVHAGGQRRSKAYQDFSQWDKHLKQKTHSTTNYWLNACTQPYHPSSHRQLAVSTLTCTHQHRIPSEGYSPIIVTGVLVVPFGDWYRLGCYDLRWLLPELSRYLLGAWGKVIAKGYWSKKRFCASYIISCCWIGTS